MKLYLLRHGHAPSASEAGVATDFERPLSELGRADVRRSAERLLERGGRPRLILHSPLLRAVQTAALAKDVLGPAQGAEAFGPLSNAAAAPELFAALQKRLSGVPETLLVGHQPQLGELAAFLANQVLELRPAGLIALEIKPEAGAAVLWTANPGSP